jgi:putative tryptophan/tyrosine transport system substrate-binding protein
MQVTLGQNLTVEYRWANCKYDQLPGLAGELVADSVAAIFAVTPVAALAAKHVTGSIPIVFVLGSDPVRDGLVSSLNHPEGNVTGATFFSNLLIQKRLELLHQLVPNANVIALLLNPGNANAEFENEQTKSAAQSLGLQLLVLDATSESEIEKSFARLRQERIRAVVVSGDALFSSKREQIASLAAHDGIATIFANKAQARAGGLMSYGAEITDAVRQGADYVARILKGAKPGDLPVQEPTTFDFVINRKTAKALGIAVPPSLLATADEVIE